MTPEAAAIEHVLLQEILASKRDQGCCSCIGIYSGLTTFDGGRGFREVLQYRMTEYELELRR